MNESGNKEEKVSKNEIDILSNEVNWYTFLRKQFIKLIEYLVKIFYLKCCFLLFRKIYLNPNRKKPENLHFVLDTIHYLPEEKLMTHCELIHGREFWTQLMIISQTQQHSRVQLIQIARNIPHVINRRRIL